MAAEWSHDFCLTCDKQIEHGAYCSQACRLADLDKASDYTTAASSYASSTGSSSSGFYFDTYKTSTSAPSSPNLYSPKQPSYFSHSASPSTSSKRSLTPSSSQTSLTSMAAASATQGLSAQAASELRSYAHAFDQVRDMRRRKQSA